MQQSTAECDAYIMDCYRSVEKKTYRAGAITYRRRKKINVLRWEQDFASQQEANDFVREHFQKLGIAEAQHEEILRRSM